MSRLAKTIRKIPILGDGARALRDSVRSPRESFGALRDRFSWIARTRSDADPLGGPSEPEHIVLVATEATVREAKLAYACRSAGLRVSLVSPNDRNEEYRREFDEVRIASNPWKALLAIDELEPDVVHLATQLWDKHRWVGPLARELRYRRSDLPLVYDQYDCLRGMLRDESALSADAIDVEKYCFENADHLCCRHLEPLVLRRQYAYETPRATYFPDYPRGTPRGREACAIAGSDELHLVYCGGIWPEDKYSVEEKGYAQYLEVARELAKQRIHLHLFPSPRPHLAGDFESFYSVYIEEAKQNRFLHISRPLPHAELIERLPTFDGALHVYGTKIDDDIGMNSPEKSRYSSANKLFDYIEAGLPVIIHRGLHHRGVVRHLGTAVPCSDISEVRQGLVEALRSGTDPNGGPSASCSIPAQAARLRRMYREVWVEVRGKSCPRTGRRADTTNT